jgi:hypothetical protein
LAKDPDEASAERTAGEPISAPAPATTKHHTDTTTVNHPARDLASPTNHRPGLPPARLIRGTPLRIGPD